MKEIVGVIVVILFYIGIKTGYVADHIILSFTLLFGTLIFIKSKEYD